MSYPRSSGAAIVLVLSLAWPGGWLSPTHAADSALSAQASFATGELRTALVDEWYDRITASDVEVVEAVLGSASPAVATAALTALSDVEVSRWLTALEDLPSPHRHLTGVLAKVDRTQVDRLARLTELIDPPAGGFSGDPARGENRATADTRELRYERVEAPLFATGRRASLDDLNQGRLANCALITAEMSLALYRPDLLAGMVTANSNGTYTVRFADGERVTVTDRFPVDEDGLLVFTNTSQAPADVDALWPLVIEKAYAQKLGGWDNTEFRWTADVLSELVATKTLTPDSGSVTIEAVAHWLNGNAVVSAGSRFGSDTEVGLPPAYSDGRLALGHAYLIVEADQIRGTVTLANPWDPDANHVELTEDELQASFARIEVSTIG